MTRRSGTLTSSRKPQVERSAKRIARQQKHLQRDITSEYEEAVKAPVPKRVSVRWEDLPQIDPLTDMQAEFFDSFAEHDATGYVLYGSAGTGKTWLAIWHALNEVLQPNSRYKKLIILRSTVPARDVGFLPGELEEKIAPYEHPYVAICSDLFKHRDAYDKLKDIGAIQFMTTAFLRGETIKDAIVVFDEIQNCNFAELKTVLTRVGGNTKIIMCGDGIQTDLLYNKKDTSGFGDLMSVTRRMPEFRHFRFTSDDIVRSGFVKSFIVACEQLDL